jgi:uncharacterized protein YhdP
LQRSVDSDKNQEIQNFLTERADDKAETERNGQSSPEDKLLEDKLLQALDDIQIPDDILTQEEPTKSDNHFAIKPLNLGSNAGAVSSNHNVNSASSVTDVTNPDVKHKEIITYS